MIRSLNRWPLCIAPAQSGRGSTPATVKVDRLAAERLRKKCYRAEETTEEHAVRLQSYIPFCTRCRDQACAAVAVSSLHNCSTCLRQVWTHIYIYIKISNRMRTLSLLRSLMLAAWQ